ncbi:hypothetical protein TNCV_1397921 [Trichonephila clavipes]|nr:hypothetical protein TNCV_1397921 [Trichonephila clavipes]
MTRQNELRFTQKLEERVKTQTLKDIRLDDAGWMLIRNKKENPPCGIFDIESNPPGWEKGSTQVMSSSLDHGFKIVWSAVKSPQVTDRRDVNTDSLKDPANADSEAFSAIIL